MTDKFKDKVVLITGGASGIGLCTAEEFAKVGASLILTDINKGALDKAKARLKSLGARVQIRVCDVSKKKAVQSMAASVIREGGVDILINNAGIGYIGELTETSIETWRRLLDINFWGPIYHIYAFLPDMISKKRGHIVNVSSGQAFFRLPTWGAYAAVKLAIGAMSEILHFEVKKHGIRVTTVYPFMVDTGFYKDVKPETFGGKMSMRLRPYYSMKPEKVGRIIFNAIKRDARVEMVSFFNDIGYYARLIPPVADVLTMITNRFLAKQAA